MPLSQIKDCLDKAVKFHKLLEDFYLKIEKKTEKDTVRFISDYLVRHEKELNIVLSKITKEQEKKILEEWVKNPSEFATCHCFDGIDISNKMTIDEIVDAGLRLNQCLINFYHDMTVRVTVKEMKDLFANLEVAQIADKRRLAQIRGM